MEGDSALGRGGVVGGVGRVAAVSLRAGKAAGAVSTVDRPDGINTRTDPGLWALQAGFVQDEYTLAGVDRPDDPVDPLRAGAARRLVAVGGDSCRERDPAERGQASGSAVVRRRFSGEATRGVNRECECVEDADRVRSRARGPTGSGRLFRQGGRTRGDLIGIVEVLEDLGGVRPLLGRNDEIDVASAEAIERVVCHARGVDAELAEPVAPRQGSRLVLECADRLPAVQPRIADGDRRIFHPRGPAEAGPRHPKSVGA